MESPNTKLALGHPLYSHWLSSISKVLTGLPGRRIFLSKATSTLTPDSSAPCCIHSYTLPSKSTVILGLCTSFSHQKKRPQLRRLVRSLFSCCLLSSQTADKKGTSAQPVLPYLPSASFRPLTCMCMHCTRV